MTTRTLTKDGYEIWTDETGVPVKAWVHGVPVEDGALTQLSQVAKLPFVFRHVAAMPDVHVGIGATVGSVIATKRAIVPAAVGVDLGCGMMAVRTTLSASDLPDGLEGVRSAIEKAVPHGRTDSGGRGDRGAWHDLPGRVTTAWEVLADDYAALVEKHPRIARGATATHLGTLGT